MKLFICCLLGSVFCLALADVKNVEDKAVGATDKSSASKPKRDASLLSSVYHGPSYKYLPPSAVSSTYDTYPGRVGSYAGYSGGLIPGIGGVYRTASGVHGHKHHGFSASGNRNIAVYHNLDNEPGLSFGGGHHGYVVPSYNPYGGQGSTQFVRPGYRGGSGSHTGAKFGHGDFAVTRPQSFAFANGNPIGSASASSGGGYYYTKGLAPSSSTSSSTGFQAADSSSSTSLGLGSHEEHHDDHVHNGGQEHVYVISNIPAGLGNSYAAKQSPVHQHPLPSAAAGSFNTKYYTQGAATGNDQGPVYAVGHKGLGYFGYTANKPQVLHATIGGLSLKQPSYSKAPFRPSTFLGAKFESSTNNDALPQQYLPPAEEGSGSLGYDYSIPSDSSVNYQEPNHQQSVEIQSNAAHEPEPSYLPPKNTQDSLYEISSAPSGNYLPPTDSYGNPYSH